MRRRKRVAIAPGHEDGPRFLRYWLHRHLSRPRRARDHRILHASQVFDPRDTFCPREHALKHATEHDPEFESLPSAEAAVYHISRLVQDAVTDWCVGLGIAVGDWACMGCGAMQLFSAYPTEPCACDGRSYRYCETRWTCQETGVSGGVDLLVDLPGDDKLKVVEVKAIQPQDFKERTVPNWRHKLRTQGYLQIIEQSGVPEAKQIDTQEAILLYVAKGGYGIRDPKLHAWGLLDSDFTPFREFRVRRDDWALLGPMKEARKVRRYHTEGVMPSGICTLATDSRAKVCPVREACFSGEYPAGDADE